MTTSCRAARPPTGARKSNPRQSRNTTVRDIYRTGSARMRVGGVTGSARPTRTAQATGRPGPTGRPWSTEGARRTSGAGEGSGGAPFRSPHPRSPRAHEPTERARGTPRGPGKWSRWTSRCRLPRPSRGKRPQGPLPGRRLAFASLRHSNVRSSRSLPRADTSACVELWISSHL
jgi:hypothetical protein